MTALNSFRLVLFVLIGTSYFAIAQQKNGNKSDEIRRVSDSNKKFSFVPPLGWDEEGGSKKAIISRRSSKSESEGNVGVTQVKSKETLEDLKKAHQTGLKKTIEGFQLDEEGELTINGKKGYYIFFSHTRGASAGYEKLYVAVYFIMGDGEYFRLTYTVIPSAYTKLKPEIKKSAESAIIIP
jgi:hypothetical protein